MAYTLEAKGAGPTSASTSSQGLEFTRHFTKEGIHPFDEIEWEIRTAKIEGEGKVVFEQEGVEVPKFWSQLATNVVASKYFRGQLGTPEREYSVRQLISRVVNTIVQWGKEGRYFRSDKDAQVFGEELIWLAVNQTMAWNSPVWYNIGVPGRKQQSSACFILSVEDTMEDILDWYKEEGMIFKWGSGSGVSLSKIRAAGEPLSGGGTASGVLSFMRAADASAGVIKSAGSVRRAAKMVVLDADHPDIFDFIDCKAKEEKKAYALINAGYDSAIDGEAYSSVYFQNANNSVRLTDEFMKAVEQDGEWSTKYITTGQVHKTVKARDLLHQIAEATWSSGDPGVQYDTTINAWHTLPNTGRITASNPCSEYLSIDDSACFAPETRISTPNGLRTIEELFNAQLGGEEILISVDIHSEHDHRKLLSYRKASVTKIGERPIVRMTLKDGRSIRVTSDHRFLTGNGWKRVDELQLGIDRIQIRESGDIAFFSSSQEEILRWQMLGWLTGDGVFSQDIVALTYGPDDADTAKQLEPEFNRLIKDSVSLGYGYSDIRECHTYVQKNGVQQISSKAGSVIKYLEEKYGMAQGTALHKDVPRAVYSVSSDLRIAYLQGLFSSDGCVRINKNPFAREVMLASSAPALLRSVQLLLNDLGIVSRITWFHPDGRKNPQGQLHITNQQMSKFVALVGMPLSHKKHRSCQEIYGECFSGSLKEPRNPVVLSIENDGSSIVYDITEPITHSLIAEGLIAHNCNLASLNLLKFLQSDNTFDIESFRKAVRLTITSQEILVSGSHFPTSNITKNAQDYRQLGLGYANLGALLMSMGLPYDSTQGRGVAAAITSLMTGEAYGQSVRIAEQIGTFAGYEKNKIPMLNVISHHLLESQKIPVTDLNRDIVQAANSTWENTYDLGKLHGYRNSQATVLAPCGTIGFLLDCDTTGIEPAIALVAHKKLVGGGVIKLTINCVYRGLLSLGHRSATNVQRVLDYIQEYNTIEGAPLIQPDELPIFDCALTSGNGSRSISWEGHVKMMGAVQPFLSGGISKTVNVPNSATIKDIEEIYVKAWKLGLKAVAIYRDGCKAAQPLNTKKTDTSQQPINSAIISSPQRKRLPNDRRSLAHKFDIAGHEGYIHIGMYEDGLPGEVFIRSAKEGSTVSGLMDTVATLTSLALQYGVPLKTLVEKFSHVRYEPSGFTKNSDIPYAKSLTDYLFRFLGQRFLGKGENKDPLAINTSMALEHPSPINYGAQSDGIVCNHCGSLMIRRAGSCFVCDNCSNTSGGCS